MDLTIDSNKKFFNREKGFIAYADIFVAIVLSLCPILQHYIGPVYNMAISALAFISLYLIMRMLVEIPTINLSKISFVLIMILYQTYRIINHGTTLTEFGQSMVIIIFMLAIALGKINLAIMLKACRIICLIASVCLIIQYICFYFFGFHLQLVPTSLFIPYAEQWALGAKTGLAGVTGKIGTFYRPSAFFLEPAHVYLYMFPHLILSLFTSEISKKTVWIPLIISCGMLLSTSGMGIAAVVGIWALFLILFNEKDKSFDLKNAFRRRNLIAVAILVVLFILACIYVPFVRRAIQRIFVPGRSGSTAITGRIKRALKLVLSMPKKQWLFGAADNTHGISFHIPSMLDVLYRHGLIGFVLSYELYVKCIFKLNLSYKLIGVVIIITSFFSAHTHSTVGMLNFLLILLSGFQFLEPPYPKVMPYVAPKRKRI